MILYHQVSFLSSGILYPKSNFSKINLCQNANFNCKRKYMEQQRITGKSFTSLKNITRRHFNGSGNWNIGRK